MDNQSNIIVTGAAGFIGSCMVQKLNELLFDNLILVDEFESADKKNNWKAKKFKALVNRNELFNWLKQSDIKIDFIIHLGARTDTTEFNYAIHEELNVRYSKDIWNYCVEKNIPLIYASSAATYGDGELGYNDDHEIVEKLQPLNPYGVSKNEFDKWVIKQQAHPPFWTGLKFFNIYGPNEYHKNRMASVIWHTFNQINANGVMKLFKSHRSDFKDGQQLRDFVYIKDVLKVIHWMMLNMSNNTWPAQNNGIYNLGTSKARSFYDLVVNTFKGLNLEPNIVYIDMPIDIRNKYQYFTEANMQKLRKAGYHDEFLTLEDGVNEYVKKYLATGKYY